MAAADLFHGLDAESDGGDDVSDWGDVVDEGVDEKRDGGGGGGGGRHAAVVQIDGERRMQSEGISGLPSRKKAKKAEDPSTSRKKSTPPAPVNSIGGSSKGARNGSDAKGSATGGSRLIMTSRGGHVISLAPQGPAWISSLHPSELISLVCAVHSQQPHPDV